jgi:hypothetical protein
VLLSRLVYLLYNRLKDPERVPDGHSGLINSWAVNLLAVAVMAWLTIYYLQVPISTEAFTLADLAKSVIPIAGGLLIAGGALRVLRRPLPDIAPGDLIVPIEALGRLIARVWLKFVVAPLDQRHLTITPVLHYLIPDKLDDDRVRDYDARMRRFEVSGAFFVVLLAMFVISLLWNK